MSYINTYDVEQPDETEPSAKDVGPDVYPSTSEYAYGECEWCMILTMSVSML